MAATKKNATEGLNGMLALTIRGELKMRGLTRDELATGAGISFDALKNYLSTSPSRARVMDLDVVERIATFFGMSALDLVGRAEQRLRERDTAAQRLEAAKEATDTVNLIDAAKAAFGDLGDADLDRLSPELRAHVVKVREAVAELADEAGRDSS